MWKYDLFFTPQNTMRSGSLVLLFAFLFVLVTDTLLFIQIKNYLQKRKYILLYVIHTLLFIIGILTYHFIVPRIKSPETYFWIGKGIGILFLFYVPKILFILFNCVAWILSKFNRLISKIIRWFALTVAFLSFFLILFGITRGRYAYKTATTEICFKELPPAFNHLSIIQLSDLHLGSYGKSYKGITELVRQVNALHPDLILFTGDMVNNFASEMPFWMETLSQLQAKYGKFAVTGNHDYGNYVKWKSKADQQENMRQFYKNMETMGFRMLNNAHTPLIVDNDTIYIAGIENWGKPPFPQYGDLMEAMKGIQGKFTILMSHDPSHWRAQVLDYHIPLTLAGHTHAMQMGIKIGNYEWSPSKYLYPEYDGLYKNKNSYLYVSRGQGYLGFPGRIGLRPEISRLILTRDCD